MSPSIPETAEKLSQALANLVADNNAVVEVHALPFISPVDGCRLSAQVIDEDIWGSSDRKYKKSFHVGVDPSRLGMGISVIRSFYYRTRLLWLSIPWTLIMKRGDILVILSSYYRYW